MRSRLRKAFALAAVLALSATACSFRPPNDVSIKAVPIDLTFGADIPEDVVPQQPTFQPLPPAVLELPPPLRTPPTQYIEPPLCPPLNPFAAAREQAPPNVTAIPTPVEQDWSKGHFLYRWNGTLVGAQDKSFNKGTMVNHKKIANVETNRSGRGFFFDIEDPFTEGLMSFTVVPLIEGEKDHGIYWKRASWPSTKPEEFGKRVQFVPARPSDAPPEFDPDNPPPDPQEYAGQHAATVNYGLKMTDFPIITGKRFVQEAENTAFNIPTGRNDPVTGEPMFRPGVVTLTSTVEVGTAAIIEVCEGLAQAWRINWTLAAQGEFNWTMVGTFWIGTQYGGLPIKEEYLLISDGQIISGNVSSNLMKLDPGFYL